MICLASPVHQVPADYDSVFGTKSCKNLHEYYMQAHYDDEAIQKMLVSKFGEEEITRTKLELKERFGSSPNTVKEYLSLLEALIAEVSWTSHSTRQNDARLESYTRQETFILANAFYGPDKDPAKVFLTRTAVPIL